MHFVLRPIRTSRSTQAHSNMATSQLRALGSVARGLRVPRRALSSTARYFDASVPSTSKPESSPATVDETQPVEINQAPNRAGVWSRSQRPRSQAMTGPRFEQTDFSLQVRACSRLFGTKGRANSRAATTEVSYGDDSQGACPVDA
jgi:hypothetical protein